MQVIDELKIKLQNDFKDELKKLNNEDIDFITSEIYLMGIIVQFFNRNASLFNNKMAEIILSQVKPLNFLCDIFNDYVALDNIFLDVFQDALNDDYENIEDFREVFHYNDEYEKTELDEENNLEDEGLIHDNEDC